MRFSNHSYPEFRAVVQKPKHDGIYSYKVEFNFTTDLFHFSIFSASFQRLFSGSFFQIPFPSLFSRAFFHGLFFKQSVQSKPEQPGSVSRRSSQIAVRLLILLLTYCRFAVDNIRDSVYSKVAFKALERASPIRFLCFIFSGGVLSCKMQLMTHLRGENPETNRKKACNVST